eukprot:g7631.t1
MMDRTFALVSHELASVRDLIKESAMSSTSILPRVYGTCWYETLASLVRAPCHPFEDMAGFLEYACRKWCSPGFLDIRLLSMGDRDTFTFSVSHMAVPLYRDERGRLSSVNTRRTRMRANRQIKLHKSAIEHYRTRLAGHVEDQIEVMRAAGFDKAAIGARTGPVKALQTALKHVANELDAEGDSEKLRINGFPVDARMAEGFVTLLGSVGVTIYQVVLGGSKPY